jgi:hypothetical protein
MKSQKAEAKSPKAVAPVSTPPQPGLNRINKTRALQGCLVALLVWIVLAALPGPPFAIGTGIDASWNYALNMIHVKGLWFGPDVIFTMGPLGYLATPDPDYTSLRSVLLFRLFTYALLIWGVVRCAKATGLGTAITVAAVLVSQTLLTQHYPDVWQAAYLSVFLAAAAYSGRSLLDLTVAGIATGVTLLFKLNEGTTAGAVFACLVAYSFWQSKSKMRAHIALALLPLFLLFAGMRIIQGSAVSTFSYVRNSLDMISGYSESVSMPGPVWQSGLAALYLLLIFSMPLLLGDKAFVMRPGIVPAVLVGFVAFKHGMVRQDGHADLVLVKIAMAALFLMVVCRNVDHKRVLGAVAVFGAAFSAIMVSQSQEWLYDMAERRISSSGIWSAAKSLVGFRERWEEVRFSIRTNLSPLRLSQDYHRIIQNDTIDVFPENIDAIRANGWNYHPRPTLQSSAAYTKRLDELDAQYLRTPEASKFALYVWYAIDGRHPFLQDPQSLMALFDRYEYAYADNKALLLRRRAQPVQHETHPIGSVTAAWEQVLTPPAVAPGEVLVGRVGIRRTFWGRVRSFFFRSSPVYASVTFKSGQQGVFRVVPVNLANGAIISPLPMSLAEFSTLVQSGASSPGNELSKLAWTCRNCSDYDSSISIAWERMQFRTGQPALPPGTGQ